MAELTFTRGQLVHLAVHDKEHELELGCCGLFSHRALLARSALALLDRAEAAERELSLLQAEFREAIDRFNVRDRENEADVAARDRTIAEQAARIATLHHQWLEECQRKTTALFALETARERIATLEAERSTLREEIRTTLLAEEERRKLTGDALQAEAALADARRDAERLRGDGWLDDRDLLAAATRAVREADRSFQEIGGSSRHWVRDCFFPSLAARGLALVRQAAALAQPATETKP